MAIAWFICPYVITGDRPTGIWSFVRKPAFIQFYKQIRDTDGGWYEWVEVLGNVCVAKIRASDATLTQIAALPGVIRLPKQLLSESLSDLTNQQKTAIVDKLGTLGYTTSEIRNSLGNNIGNKTLGDILKFAATRRVTPRREGDTLVFDGPVRPCGRSIESVDSGVSE